MQHCSNPESELDAGTTTASQASERQDSNTGKRRLEIINGSKGLIIRVNRGVVG